MYMQLAVDMWSAGIILLCLLSKRYPFFRAQDDQSAMAQIISLMGSKKCNMASKAYGISDNTAIYNSYFNYIR